MANSDQAAYPDSVHSSSESDDDEYNFYSGAAKRFKKEKQAVYSIGTVKLVNPKLPAAENKSSQHIVNNVEDSSDEELFKEMDSKNHSKDVDLDESEIINFNQVERLEDIEVYSSPDISINPVEEKRTSSSMSIQEVVVDLEEDPLYCASLNNSELNPSLNDEETAVVKVRFIGQKVWRIELKRADIFKVITKKLSEKTGMEAERIHLYFNNQLLNQSDTLKTVPIKIADIIDAVICSEEDEIVSTSSNMLEFKVQAQSRNSQVIVSIRAEDPMKTLMQKYSDATNIDLSKLTFRFDGENLEEDDTPHSLELEGGECIDVFVKE